MSEEIDIGSMPVDRLSKLSGDTRDKVIDLINAESDNDSPVDRTSSKVSKKECELLKKAKADGATIEEILESSSIDSRSGLYYHLNDECQHKSRVRLTYSECGWMRYKASKGAPTKTIAVLYNVSLKVAREHLIGECSHEGDPEPVDPQLLRGNAYRNKNVTSSVCPVCGETFRHKNYKDRTTCSRECCTTYAAQKSAESRVLSD